MAFYKIAIILTILKENLSRELWPEEKLHKNLTQNYDKAVRPLNSANLVFARTGFLLFLALHPRSHLKFVPFN